MLCAGHAVRTMSTAHGSAGGSIVNVASVAARTGGLPGLVPYAATKGALVTFTRGLSNEVGSEGIRVNSVSPGVIATDATTAVPQAEDAAAGRLPTERPVLRGPEAELTAAHAAIMAGPPAASR